MTTEDHLTLDSLNKSIVVAIASTLIDEDSPIAESTLLKVLEIMELTFNNYESNLHAVGLLMNNVGLRVLNTIKTFSRKDKEYVKRAINYAFEHGGNKSNPETRVIYNQILTGIGFEPQANNIQIKLDSSVKSITRSAAYHLSGVISNGISFSRSNNITIYKNKIIFESKNHQYNGLSGNIAPNFYVEYGNLVYYYTSIKCSMFKKTLEYVGMFEPTQPDNEYIFNLIYPRFS